MALEQRIRCDGSDCDKVIVDEGREEANTPVVVVAKAMIPNPVQERVRREAQPGTTPTLEVEIPPSLVDMLPTSGGRRKYMICADCWANAIGEETQTENIQMP